MSLISVSTILGLLVLCWFLTKASLMTPYISASVAYSGGLLFQYPAQLILPLVICFYFTCLLSNEDVDNNAILASDTSLKVAARSPFLKTFKILIFISFFILPIPKPPGYFTGILSFVLITIVLSSYFKSHFLPLSLSPFIIWLTSCLFPSINIVVPLLAGIVLFRSNRYTPSPSSSPLDYSSDFPGIGPLLWSFFFTWITPGLSCSAASSVSVSPGPWRSIFANSTSLALEAWNLSLLFRGDLSSKSPLADIITLPNRLNHTPLLDVYGSSLSDIILAILPLCLCFLIYWFDSFQLLSPNWFISIPFCCQAFMTSGTSALFIIAVGYSISLLFDRLSVSSECHSTIVIMPMIF